MDWTNVKYLGSRAKTLEIWNERRVIDYGFRQRDNFMRDRSVRVESNVPVRWGYSYETKVNGEWEKRYKDKGKVRLDGPVFKADFIDEQLKLHPSASIMIPSVIYFSIREQRWPEMTECSAREILANWRFATWRDTKTVITVTTAFLDPTGILFCPLPIEELSATVPVFRQEFRERVLGERHFRAYSQTHKELEGLRCQVNPEGYKGRVVKELTKYCTLVELSCWPDGSSLTVVDTNKLKVFFL